MAVLHHIAVCILFARLFHFVQQRGNRKRDAPFSNGIPASCATPFSLLRIRPLLAEVLADARSQLVIPPVPVGMALLGMKPESVRPR